MSTTHVCSNRISRRWLIGITIVVLPACAALATFGYWSIETENDWRCVEAELDGKYRRWRLADLEADRSVVDDGSNAAAQIILAHRKAPKLRVPAAKNYDAIFAKLQPTIQLNSQQAALIREQLNTAPAAIAEARKLKDMPRGRFTAGFGVDFITTQIPHHCDAYLVSDWLFHDAYLLAQEDRCDESLDNCRAILNIGRTTGDDRFLMTHLMRIGHQAVAVEAAERVLAQGTPSKESLAALQSLVAQEMTESSWTGSLKGELAGWHFLFTQIRNGKLDRTYLRDLRRWRRSENTFEEIGDHFAPTMMDHAPDCLRFMDCRIEISKLPLQEQKAKLRELEETFDKSNPLSCLTANGSQVLDAELRSQGLLRTTLVALACERYRLQHNNWPAQLDDLVAESFLPALPVDPVDGQALRYRRDANGVVIWSIGIDEKDDQGDVVRAPLDKQTNGSRVHRPPAGDDVGFRLWNPQSRRKTLSP